MLEFIGLTITMEAAVGLAWLLIAIAYDYYYEYKLK